SCGELRHSGRSEPKKPEIYEPHLECWASLRLSWSVGRACGSSLMEQQPLKTKPSQCLPPHRLRTRSMMLIQLLQSKVVSKSSSAMEQVRRWLSRSSKAHQRTYSPPLTCSGWTTVCERKTRASICWAISWY